jgi:hypothetical protein
MSAATLSDVPKGCRGFQFCDFDAKFRGVFGHMFPGERLRPLRSELISERHWVVVIEQNKMIADRQVQPLLDD